MQIYLHSNVSIPYSAFEFKAVLSAGPGGQHVNKTASAIQLKFNILASDLPAAWKDKLLAYPDHRISKAGIITIKGKQFRSQHKNKNDVICRFRNLVIRATLPQKTRLRTKSPKRANEKRLARKKIQSAVKKGRQKNWLPE